MKTSKKLLSRWATKTHKKYTVSECRQAQMQIGSTDAASRQGPRAALCGMFLAKCLKKLTKKYDKI